MSFLAARGINSRIGCGRSRISFDAGIPRHARRHPGIGLRGGYDPASLLGDSFQVFDWTGVSPTGAFANISSNLPAGYSWDTSQLYSTGDVTLIREPSSLALLGADQVGPGPRAKPQSPPMTLRKTHSFAPLRLCARNHPLPSIPVPPLFCPPFFCLLPFRAYPPELPGGRRAEIDIRFQAAGLSER